MAEHIVAVFQSSATAMNASRELEAAGIPAAAIRTYAQGGGAASGASDTVVTGGAEHSTGGGFWAWLLGDEPAADTSSSYRSSDVYDRQARSGNTVLSVDLRDDSLIHTAMSILESHQPLELDESTDEEASGEAASRTGVLSSGTDYSTSGSLSSADRPMPQATAGSLSSTGETAASRPSTGDEVIPLAEEQLNVGTRKVDKGTTRVRRYVVEQPVERDVTLHGERVTVERRRPVGSSGAPGANAFEERVVEVHETEEEPVLEKTARVVEEVAIKRESTERHERVSDTVRRDEVEISPDKGSPATPSRP